MKNEQNTEIWTSSIIIKKTQLQLMKILIHDSESTNSTYVLKDDSLHVAGIVKIKVDRLPEEVRVS